MSIKDEALKLALEALVCLKKDFVFYADQFDREITNGAITAIKEALAQEQEPVDFDAIIADIEAISCRYRGDPSHDHCPYKIRSESADTVRRHASYYTTPPQPTQVKLTDEGIEELANEYLFAEEDLGMLFVGGSVEFARAIETAHGIKENT